MTFTCPCLEGLNREREGGVGSTPPLNSLVKRAHWIRLFHCRMSGVGRASVTPAAAWATAPHQTAGVTARRTWKDRAAAGL